MGKYYVYCNNNQAYHVLIHNTIASKSLTPNDFRASTVSFQTENYIFVTGELLPKDLLHQGCTDLYYPVVLELDFSGEDIPAWPVVKNEEKISIMEKAEFLSEAEQKEGFIGALILGEIPLAFLSGICFLEDRDRIGFKKSSTDLWFPEDLYKEYIPAEKSLISNEDVKTIAKAKAASSQVEKDVIKSIQKRDRVKAAFYYAIEATENWVAGKYRTNMDGILLSDLDDEEGSLEKAYKDKVEKASGKSLFPSESEYADDLNKHICHLVFEALMDAVDDLFIDAALFQKLPEYVTKNITDIQAVEKVREAFGKVDGYVYKGTEKDPDQALDSLEGFSSLKALMFFLDQQKNADFLRNVCKKLSQEERRYAYMMFALLRGMSEVDKTWKSKRRLEVRLEQICMRKYPADNVISDLKDIRQLVLYKSESGERNPFDIEPVFLEWFDEQEALDLIMAGASSDQLEKIYKLMKDKSIPEDKLYSLAEPVTITISTGDKVIKTITIENKKGAKAAGMEIQKVVSKEKETFNAEQFKKILSDGKRFRKVYRKHTDAVQDICREAKK